MSIAQVKELAYRFQEGYCSTVRSHHFRLALQAIIELNDRICKLEARAMEGGEAAEGGEA